MAHVTAALSHLPAIRLLRTYRPEWLTPDLLAGLTVWALLVPQALAYGQLAGVDPVVGLYASIGATIGYLLFGSVRTMSTGPEGTIALLAASVVAPLAAGDPTRYLGLMAALALIAGSWLIFAAVLRLGFVTRFLSRPLLTGYIAGSAIVMIVSQLDSLLGISLEAQDDTLAELRETLQRLGETDPTTLLVGVLVIVIAVVMRRIDRRLPAYLIAMLVAIVISAVAGLEEQGVAVVGAVEPGLPDIGLPSVSVSDIVSLMGPALGIALLVFADSGVTGQLLARRSGDKVDGNQEFLGLGAANLGAGLTGGFPVNGSQSRSFTAADVGGKSQLLNVVVLGLVLLTLLVLTPLFEPLPKSALAAVILVVAVGLLDPGSFRALARIDRRELALAAFTALVVVGVGMLAGVLVTVVLSLFLVAVRAALPNRAFLVRVPGSDSFRDEQGVKNGMAEPGILAYRFDGPLFFANAQLLADDIEEALAGRGPEAAVRWIVIDAEGVTDIDTTGVGVLDDLRAALVARDVTLVMARVKAPIFLYLERAGVVERIGRDRIFLEVHDAVGAGRAALARTDASGQAGPSSGTT
jgi:SulP family sulfate permease